MNRTDDQEAQTLQKNTQERDDHTNLVDSSLTSRLGFIRKVYAILLCQLTFTAFITTLCISSEDAANFTINTTFGAILFILAFIFLIVSMCALFCFKQHRKVPDNYIWLCIFTLCESYLVGASCASVVLTYTNAYSLIYMALFMTVFMTVGLTIYACTTKTDFTIFIGIMWALCIGLLIFGILLLFTDNKVLHIVYCVLAIIIYGIYLIIDTQLVVGNGRYSLGTDDYVLGAIIIYIDIIVLFLELLRLLALLFGKQ